VKGKPLPVTSPKFFQWKLSRKFAVKLSLKSPQQDKRVATLPREILMSEKKSNDSMKEVDLL